MRWFTAAMTVLLLVGFVLLATTAETPLEVAFPLIMAPMIAYRVVLPLLLIAAAFRWLSLRWLSPDGSVATAVGTTVGLAAFPVLLMIRVLAAFLLDAGQVLRRIRSEGLVSLLEMIAELAPALMLDLLWAPVIVAGGVAGYLASAAVSVRTARWWLLVSLAAMFGSLMIWFAD